MKAKVGEEMEDRFASYVSRPRRIVDGERDEADDYRP